MGSWAEQYPSKYLKAADWPVGQEARLKIDFVERQTMPDDGGEKPVLFFQDRTKGLILNVANGGTLATHFGDDMDAWKGREIILFRDTCLFAGKRVAALRLKVPSQPATHPAPALDLTPEGVQAELDAAGNPDDIPF